MRRSSEYIAGHTGPPESNCRRDYIPCNHYENQRGRRSLHKVRGTGQILQVKGRSRLEIFKNDMLNSKYVYNMNRRVKMQYGLLVQLDIQMKKNVQATSILHSLNTEPFSFFNRKRQFLL